MPYGKVDELAINTIRTLAVRLPIFLCPSSSTLPHHEATPPSQQSFFLNMTTRCARAIADYV
jgi:hypothetical protein